MAHGVTEEVMPVGSALVRPAGPLAERAAEVLRAAAAISAAADAAPAPDATDLAEQLAAAWAGLREALPGLGPAAAARATAVALDLAEVRQLLADETLARRGVGVLQVQRALAQLRTVGSVDQMIAKAPEVLCTRCGFRVAILWRVEDGVVTPAAAHSVTDPGWNAKVQAFIADRPPLQLDALTLETQMLRRRVPMIVEDAMNNPRAMRDLTRVSRIRSYVAAPVMPEGQVIGFIHATRMSTDDAYDRDLLSAFAEGYGYALERSILQQRLHQQGEKVRDLVRSTEALLTDAREAGLQIASSADPAGEVRRSTSQAAPQARIHSLLTRRELEIIELMATGETNRQIAERMVVTEGTVKGHVSQILKKLHASNRAEAVSRYMRIIAGG
ncbi:LuxR C-terminal-related transcriptional regulator [Paraconexibacter antarcticus]|uniref:LuxR C-terminal-related transcriptional regulator n=1 Tax=Paraconexibacter antarcticus TaxID=2949664 RepID=A0ABY5E0L4_9ACTN|nr:LuxR C-terminal-related transcriptional regulator [Paraconexibacter antarcticus]UTI66692.1 LuxR C-terminal-related transcriptional regulator [Paraconexibacter antarcticus]